MARIRTIKPDFWTDEKVVELSPLARLLFIGLWNFADDQGRMVCSPKRIKMQIFPADDADTSALLGEIRGSGLITVYTVDGIEYLQVCGFEKHQKVDKRTPSKLPAPPTSAESPRVSPPEKEKEKEGKDISAPDGAALELESEFAEWWEQYPHKVDKAAAQRAYRKARKKASRETLLTGLEAYKRTKEDWRAWKGPAAWLNGERWNDAPAGASATPAPAGDETIRQNVKAWLATGANPRAMKFPPGHPDCKIPKHILLEFRDELKQHGYEVAA